MRTVLTLRVNRDRTITVRCGRAVEHLSIDGKTKSALWDAVKYACVSKGHGMKDEELLVLFDRAWKEVKA